MERRLHHLYRTVEESDDYRILEGVEELLPRMLEEGYLLGLVTGNVEAAAHIKLHRGRLNRYFSFGGYGSDSTDRGELTRVALHRAAVVSGGSVTPNQAFVVGDTPHDVAAAHAAGVPCVGEPTEPMAYKDRGPWPRSAATPPWCSCREGCG